MNKTVIPTAQEAAEPVWRTAVSGAQILFVAFGATEIGRAHV